ncbi:hypothetical protein KQI65_01970 [bacterium]|nr:hypothetical protein [bacterium]
MKHIIAMLTIVLLTSSAAMAQSAAVAPTYVGVTGGAAMQWQGGAPRTCDLPDCLEFPDGSGTGVAFGARLLYPIVDALALRVGVGFSSVASAYSSTQHNYPILGKDNEIEMVDMTDEFELSLSVLQLEAGVVYHLLSPGLYLTAAPVLSLPLSAQWKQTESITGPAGTKYLNGSEELVLLDEDLPDASAYLSLRLGAGSLFMLTDAVAVAPEVTYLLPVSDLQSDLGMSVSGLDLSLALLLRI